MIQLSLVASAFLAVLVSLVAIVLQRRNRRVYTTDGGQPAAPGTIKQLAESPLTWTIGFVVLSGVALGGAVLFVGDIAVPAPIPGSPGLWLAGLLGISVGVYLLWGIYHSSRYRGLHQPAALAVTGWAVGLLVIGLVVLKLLGFV